MAHRHHAQQAVPESRCLCSRLRIVYLATRSNSVTREGDKHVAAGQFDVDRVGEDRDRAVRPTPAFRTLRNSSEPVPMKRTS